MSVTLKASFGVTPGKGLSIQSRIENAGAVDILVLDRLWKLEDNRKALDDEHTYRFERDGSLRVLLGPAPLPRMKSALYRNVPMATRVPAGGSIDHEIVLAPPIKEHSPYFPEVDPAAYAPTPVGAVHLVVDYLPIEHVEGRPDLVIRPSAVDPTALEIDNPVLALAAAKRLVESAPLPTLLEVLRRTDELDRLDLPGEAPEPLKLA
jgi:hypothetical protein